MRELHFTPDLDMECWGHARPPIKRHLPTMGNQTTEHNVTREFLNLLGSMKSIEEAIRTHSIPSPWIAYWALHEELVQFRRWFPPVRIQVRRYHQTIPRLGDAAITSFCEAAEILCSHRVNWLDCEIDYPDDKRMGDFSFEWRATAIVAEAERIYKKWPFEPIDFYELSVGLKLEIAYLATIDPATLQIANDPSKLSIPKPMVDSITKACDAWLIKQWEKGKTLQQILSAIGKKPTWSPPVGESGLRYRLDAAYGRAGKLRPKRKQGRRSIRSK